MLSIDDINNVPLESLIPDVIQDGQRIRFYTRICNKFQMTADYKNRLIASYKTLVADTMFCNEVITVAGIKKTLQIYNKHYSVLSDDDLCRLIRYYSAR